MACDRCGAPTARSGLCASCGLEDELEDTYGVPADHDEIDERGGEGDE